MRRARTQKPRCRYRCCASAIEIAAAVRETAAGRRFVDVSTDSACRYRAGRRR
jgi:hypothetical protein